MMRKVGSILAVSGFHHQITKRGIAFKKCEKPPKILITGMSLCLTYTLILRFWIIKFVMSAVIAIKLCEY